MNFRSHEVYLDRLEAILLSHISKRATPKGSLEILAQTPEESFGTFALFGSRGTGKSTLIQRLTPRLHEKLSDDLVIVDTLDCTAVTPRIPLIISILFILESWFLRNRGSASTDRFARVKKRMLPFDFEYRKLNLALAVTASEYSDIAEKEITSRLTLSDHISELLNNLLSPNQHLLLILDDADLSLGPITTEVMATFLDTFRDPRLLFLLVADPIHLAERLQVGGLDHVSPSTKSLLLEKLIPVQHRVYIEPWSDPLSFLSLTARRNHVLGTLLKHSLPSQLEFTELEPILPRNARGLNDLYHSLEAHFLESDDLERLANAPRLELRSLLVLIANCSARPELAKRLSLDFPGTLTAAVSLELRDNEHATWWDLVFQAKDPTTPLTFLRWREEEDRSRQAQDNRWLEFLIRRGIADQRNFLRQVLVRRLSLIQAQIGVCRAVLAGPLVEFTEVNFSGGISSRWLNWSLQKEGAKVREVSVSVGWAELIRSFDPESLKSLRDTCRILGFSDQPPTALDIDLILPPDLRSLILLIDQLARIPWDQILASEGWRLSEQLERRLALATARAYLATSKLEEGSDYLQYSFGSLKAIPQELAAQGDANIVAAAGREFCRLFIEPLLPGIDEQA